MNNRLALAAAAACLSFTLASCVSSGRSEPVPNPHASPAPTTGGYTSPPTGDGDPSIPLDQNASLLDEFAHNAPPSKAKSPQEQQEADDAVTAWFQDNVKDQYTVTDHRVIVAGKVEPWYYFSNQASSLAGSMGITQFVSLPVPMSPFTPTVELQTQGWRRLSGPDSSSNMAWEVKRPHAGVVAMAYLPALADQGVVVAYFELKPLPGRA